MCSAPAPQGDCSRGVRIQLPRAALHHQYSRHRHTRFARAWPPRTQSSGTTDTAFLHHCCIARYAVNINGIRRPCQWLDVGCRASTTSGCIPQDGTPVQPSGRERDAGMSLWAAALLVVLVALVLLVWGAHRINLSKNVKSFQARSSATLSPETLAERISLHMAPRSKANPW